mmetsp:Transcript_3985/g.5934  ORF Transcript_3985/g.5934 Transcript_3985/m.5934 type:complete len:207 (-) Transcript_3985:84-704(-)
MKLQCLWFLVWSFYHGFTGEAFLQISRIGTGQSINRISRPHQSCRCYMSSMNDGMLPEEWEKEREVELLEEAVARADLSTQKPWKLPVAGIRVQTLKEAAAARDRLTSLHMDDMAAVLRINADFYQAFLDRNIDSMRTLWMDSDDVICIHPGAELVGYNNIVSAWEKAFAASKKDSTAALDPFFSGAVIGGHKDLCQGNNSLRLLC